MHLSHHASISYALHTLCRHVSILRASIFCAHFFPFSANTSTASSGEHWRGPTCSLHAHNACCMRAICSLQAFCKLWQAFYRAHIFIRVAKVLGSLVYINWAYHNLHTMNQISMSLTRPMCFQLFFNTHSGKVAHTKKRACSRYIPDNYLIIIR